MEIKIIAPTEGQTILGDKVTISFIVSDFYPGQDGFINLWLDNPIEEVTTAARISSSFNHILSDLPQGLHKLSMEAVGKNNLSFSPKVKQTVSFATILPQNPTVTILPSVQNKHPLEYSNYLQFVLLTVALFIAISGIILKLTFGKPKIWE